MSDGNKEYEVGSDPWLRNAFHIKTEGDLVNIVFDKGDLNEEQNFKLASFFVEGMENVFDNEQGKMFMILVDMTPLADDVDYLSKRVRAVYAKIMSHKQVGHIAIFGVNKFYEVAIDFMIGMLFNKDKVKLFKEKEDAIRWLRS